ncbi:hypothetical protein HYQ45_005357 [Verticillium longisporum]|uniref:BZIP domain-containing protein n=1 Tax=Verticillium longisporum TaxID=100787 RepID=A0A8I3AX17_VERLO|nr:hypothetical protein HYQ45_005357 [Verticillium longisporum]
MLTTLLPSISICIIPTCLPYSPHALASLRPAPVARPPESLLRLLRHCTVHSAFSSNDSAEQDNGPLSNLNLGFLKGLTEKKATRDGQPPKRRGPKPDSKPAMTRRQELNRQAQRGNRTHRERKELYIKALEDDVLRLKEIFSNMSQDKDKVAEENKQLRQLLTQHGIPLSSVGLDDTCSPRPSRRNPPPPPGQQQQQYPQHGTSQHLPGQYGLNGVDYEQAGIDFVLTLEKPCMNHMPWLLERSSEMGGEPCGHALMASCPPEPFPELTPDIPFGYAHVNGDLNSGQRTWELSKADLGTLLALSKRLNLDGEITPAEDFAKLTEELSTKIRCYGFGAVLEEFEIRDALENVMGAYP